MRCADVTYDMAGPGLGRPAYEAEVGDLLWDPKAGKGHVIVREARCNSGRKRAAGEPVVDCGCGGWTTEPCNSLTAICECGRDGSCRDHHDKVLRRSAASGDNL